MTMHCTRQCDLKIEKKMCFEKKEHRKRYPKIQMKLASTLQKAISSVGVVW